MYLCWCTQTLNYTANHNSVCVCLILMRSFGDAVQGQIDRNGITNKNNGLMSIFISVLLLLVSHWITMPLICDSCLMVVSSHWVRVCHRQKPAKQNKRRKKQNQNQSEKLNVLMISNRKEKIIYLLVCMIWIHMYRKDALENIVLLLWVNESNEMEWQMKRCALNPFSIETRMDLVK